MARLLGLLILLVLTSAPAVADDVFVNNLAGNDSADGRVATGSAGLSGPVRTIARALQLATAGDRIVLAKTEQPYRESVGLSGPRNSGNDIDTFILLGNGAVLDGTLAIPTRAWEHFEDDVFRFRPRALGFQMLFRDGKPLVQVHAAPSAVKLPALKPLQWCLFQGYAYLRIEKLKSPLDYQLSHSVLASGITLYGVRKVLIADVIVQGFRYDGISVADRAADVRLTGVTLRGNGRSGMSVAGASKVKLESSLVGDNGQVQVRVEYPGELHVLQSDLLDNSAPRFELVGGGRLLVDGQPVRVN